MNTRCLCLGGDTCWKLKVFCAKVVTPPYLMLGLRIFGLSVTCWSKGRDKPPSKVGTSGFWDYSVTCWSKGGDNPHPKLGLRILELSVTCWSKGRDEPPIQSWDLGFFWDSVSLADQKAETIPIQSWTISFWDSVSLADQKVEITPHPNLEPRFFGVMYI